MGLGKLVFEIGLKGVDAVMRGLKGTKKGLEDTGKAAHDAGEKAKKFSGGVFHMAESLTKFTLHAGLAATGAGALGTALSAPVLGGAFDAAVGMDSLTRSLAVYSKDSDDLLGQLSRLHEIAKLPGLGFEDAVKGSLRLQAVEFSAAEAEKAVTAFGNAIASSGGGKEQLDGAILGLSQIVSRGKVTADNINQISNAIPQLRTAMKSLYGTADTEALQGMNLDAKEFANNIADYFSKAAKVSGGLQNAIDNFGDSVRDTLLPLGKGIGIALDSLSSPLEGVFDVAKRASTALGEVFAAVGTSGVLGETLKKVTGLTDGMFGADFQANIARVAATVLTVAGNLPATFRAGAEYAHAMFSTIVKDAKTIFDYIDNRTVYYVTFITDVFKQLAEKIEALDKWLNTDMFDGLSKKIGATDVMKPPPSAPVLKLDPLPAMPDFLKMLGSGIDENTAKIMANIKPLPELPSGLPYGGGGAGGASSSSPESEDSGLLKAIEKNTKKTADVLDMRSVFGGGPLAGLGVTPAELFGGRTSATGGERSQPVLQVTLGGTGGTSRSVSSVLEAAVQSIVLDQLQRAPRSFNPRLAGA